MLQAGQNATTRRTLLLGGAATFSTAAIPSLAVASPSTFAEEEGRTLRIAYDAIIVAENMTLAAEQEVAAWRTANPEPLFDESDKKAHARRMSSWCQRRNEAIRRANLAGTQIALLAAKGAHQSACVAVADVPARTLPDLIAKARLALHDCDEHAIIAGAIVSDLLDLDGG